MRKLARKDIFTILAAFLWISMLGAVFIWMDTHHISLRELPRLVKGVVRGYGPLGSLILIILYLLRSFLFLPASVLTIVAGTVFGPFWGSILNIIGENLSAGVSFFLGRIFGRRFIREHETAWLKKYDELLTKDGFIPILLMRFFLFPFDIVNIGSGMTGISYKTFGIATFFGLLPAIITFTVLGNAVNNPRSFIIFGILIAIILATVWILQKVPAVRKRLGLHIPFHN
ncbi:TVP38/TMEM64 family protein [Candidatus Uhrbacteria bacterium]|nr:TVP38/TMEM64 family protein [Candidatus Uhrbacteria bacterium]